MIACRMAGMSPPDAMNFSATVLTAVAEQLGGAELYRTCLDEAVVLHLTEVDADLEGDVRFPAWRRDEWQEVSRERHVAEDLYKDPGPRAELLEYFRALKSFDAMETEWKRQDSTTLPSGHDSPPSSLVSNVCTPSSSITSCCVNTDTCCPLASSFSFQATSSSRVSTRHAVWVERYIQSSIRGVRNSGRSVPM